MANTPDNRIPGQAGNEARDFHSEFVREAGDLQTRVELGGTYITEFEGEGLIVDLTGTDGSGSLTTVSGKGLVGIEDLIPKEAQLRRGPNTGDEIQPTHQARVKITAVVELTPLTAPLPEDI